MTNDLTGRALDEAAARAMGTRIEPTMERCLDWLHERWLEAYGRDIKEGVYRLVVAVAAREATDGK